jgi:hypothetical protein
MLLFYVSYAIVYYSGNVIFNSNTEQLSVLSTFTNTYYFTDLTFQLFQLHAQSMRLPINKPK